ncbi:MAG: hypothetical protein M1827_003028 [Pycnora praestabilis]|nr:MAG: hypothetical protein M1827_003028 [Pycnora praestabilis]
MTLPAEIYSVWVGTQAYIPGIAQAFAHPSTFNMERGRNPIKYAKKKRFTFNASTSGCKILKPLISSFFALNVAIPQVKRARIDTIADNRFHIIGPPNLVFCNEVTGRPTTNHCRNALLPTTWALGGIPHQERIRLREFRSTFGDRLNADVPEVPLPLQASYGDCVVALYTTAELGYFPRYGQYPADLATWADVFLAGTQLMNRCILSEHTGGIVAFGDQNHLVLIVYARGSECEESINQAYGPVRQAADYLNRSGGFGVAAGESNVSSGDEISIGSESEEHSGQYPAASCTISYTLDMDHCCPKPDSREKPLTVFGDVVSVAQAVPMFGISKGALEAYGLIGWCGRITSNG